MVDEPLQLLAFDPVLVSPKARVARAYIRPLYRIPSISTLAGGVPARNLGQPDLVSSLAEERRSGEACEFQHCAVSVNAPGYSSFGDRLRTSTSWTRLEVIRDFMTQGDLSVGRVTHGVLRKPWSRSIISLTWPSDLPSVTYNRRSTSRCCCCQSGGCEGPRSDMVVG